jgi:glycerol-3-phosphate acyltransferase PlsY
MGYCFGLIQTGYLYGRLHHIDVRSYGSGNAGTTNTMRVLGKKAGIITYFGDALKAVFAGLLTILIYGNSQEDIIFVLLLYTGLGVVLGHNFPFYMNFRGGKGIAASSGVILALFDWKLVLLAFFTFVIVTAISKYVSLGSLCMMAGFFVELVLFGQLGWISNLQSGERLEAYIIGFILTAMAFIRHRANIDRLLHGTERKIGQKKEAL